MKTPVAIRLSDKARENRFVITFLRGINGTVAIERALETEAALSGTKRDVQQARNEWQRREAARSEAK